MNKEKDINWLYEELPKLVQEGVLSEEAAENLRKHYGAPDRLRSHNLIFIISGILGSILIGLGIILLFAYNWDEFSRGTRAVITFIPLIASEIIFGYAYFRKRNSIAWMEGTAGFLFLMAGAAISLVGQIYNTGGTLNELLFTWLLLGIPLLYISNAVLTFALYMVLLTCWSFSSYYTGGFLTFFGDYLGTSKFVHLALVIAVMPFLARNINRDSFTARGNIIGWFFAIPLFLSSLNFMSYNGGLSTLFYYSTLTTLLYAIGKVFYDKTASFWQKPLQATAIASIFLLALFCTYEWYWRDFTGYSWFLQGDYTTHRSMHLMLYLAGGLFMIITALIISKRIKNKMPVNYFPLLLPFIIAVGILINYFWTDFTIAIILCDLFITLWGIYYIYTGVKLDKTSLVNAGMLFLSVLIAVRFISTDAGFLLKGIVFIVLGCGFLGANYYLMKKQKNNG